MLTRERGVSLVHLAKEIGIADTALSRHVHNRSFPGGRILVKLAEYFSVSTDWLLCRTEIRCPMPPKAGGYIARRSRLDLAMRGELPDGAVIAFEIMPDVCIVSDEELAMASKDPAQLQKDAKRAARKKP